MNKLFDWKCSLIVVSMLAIAAANEPLDKNPFAQLFPPERIVQHRNEIGLTDEQFQQIRNHAETGGREVSQLKPEMDEASKNLTRLLKGNRVDEEAALAQLEDFLDLESKMKRIHLQVMIRVRNVLKEEQRRILATKIASTPNPKQLERRLRAKVSRIQREVERRAQDGTPPLEAARAMQEFDKAMRAAKHQQAEAILDRVMKMLNLNGDPKSIQKGPSQQDSSSHSKAAQKALASVPVSTKLSRQDLQTEVANLRKKDVAWRKIAWETCLIDGLKKSRDEKKPIVLWVFIDRPIDDERC